MFMRRDRVGMKRSTSSIAATLIAFGLACVVPAETGQAEDIAATPLVATPIAPPNPVLGSDDKIHLAYELVLMNMAPSAVALEKIETLDAESGAVIGTLDGEDLAKMFRLNGGGKGTEVSAGGSGLVFMDVTLAKNAKIPKALRHRFAVGVAKAPNTKAASDRDPAPEPPEQVSFVTDPLAVGPAAIVIAPPLKGARWVAGGGCCTPYSYHRGATLPINGSIHAPERFAIDFVQLNDKNQLNSGPIDQLSSYAYLGEEIYAVAAGTVVGMEDGLPEQVPGKLPADATIETAGGNHVVVDIGEGRFAFYAHMQPGTVRVKLGDKVTTGQVLGLLGNSGNTDSPHLHFQVMDGPSPLVSNGLPFVFSAFTGEGQIVDEQPLFTGGAVTIDKEAMPGPHENEMPLIDQVLSFP
jgi:murein DD-endopeptidase MepM/ murein hydrolase activator NlpD